MSGLLWVVGILLFLGALEKICDALLPYTNLDYLKMLVELEKQKKTAQPRRTPMSKKRGGWR